MDVYPEEKQGFPEDGQKTPPPSYYGPDHVIQLHQAPVIVETERYTWCHLVTAVVSFFFCHIIGFVATVMALLSYADHKVQHYALAKRKKAVALKLAIVAIVLGVVLFTLFMVFSCMWDEDDDHHRGRHGDDDDHHGKWWKHKKHDYDRHH